MRTKDTYLCVGLVNGHEPPHDWLEMRMSAIRHARKIFSQPAFDPFRGAELAPAPARSAIRRWMLLSVKRQRAPIIHAAHAAWASQSDPLAVVDEATRVIGLERLCVVDKAQASIIPQITNGNLNTPTIMLAEKAADHILRCALLQRETKLPPPSTRPESGARSRETVDDVTTLNVFNAATVGGSVSR